MKIQKLKDWVINYFISNGAPPEKLILGLAFYGKSFVWNSDARMIGEQCLKISIEEILKIKNNEFTSDKFGKGGPAKFGDFVGYKQVCGYLNSNWKRVWVADQQVPFIFQGNIMVGYDDPESIAIKVAILTL